MLHDAAVQVAFLACLDEELERRRLDAMFGRFRRPSMPNKVTVTWVGSSS